MHSLPITPFYQRQHHYVPWRHVIYTTYISTLLIAIVQGMVILLIPLYAIDTGTSIAGAGMLFALRSAGTMLADIPVGLAIQRFGEKKLIQLGMIFIAASCLGFSIWTSWPGMAICMLLFGIGVGSWTLARHSFISAQTVNHQRGRTMSVLAGLQRAGTFFGPVIGGGISQYYGYESAFLLGTAFTLMALTIATLNLAKMQQQGKTKSINKLFAALPVFIRQHRHTFITAGVFMITLRLVRGARQLLLPLWGNHIGLNTAEIGLVFGASAVMDVALLYVGGFISDRFGRKWAAVPCLILLSLSMLLMPYCLTYTSFLLLALLAGVANGLGGGIIMTLGADLAPKESRSTFLGAWRLIGDLSGTVTPMFIGWIGSLFVLGSAAIVSGVIGLLGSTVMLLLVPETLIKSTKTHSVQKPTEG